MTSLKKSDRGQIEQAGPSIRAQAKKPKNQGSQHAQYTGQAPNNDKIVVKPVLANPFTIPCKPPEAVYKLMIWRPSLPKHVQSSVLNTLPSLVPPPIAEYHTSRDRCHRTEKRKERTRKNHEAIKEAKKAASESAKKQDKVEQAENHPGEGDGIGTIRGKADLVGAEKENVGDKRPRIDPDIDGPNKRTKTTGSPHPSNKQISAVKPDVPEIMKHMVMGINEVVKHLEKQIDQLKIRIMIMGDTLSDQNKRRRKEKKRKDLKLGNEEGGRVLLPTAPPREDEDVEDDQMEDDEDEVEDLVNEDPEARENPKSHPTESKEKKVEEETTVLSSASRLKPLEWIIIPILSISPQSLISPILSYCATFNTLLYQYNHLSKICNSRVPKDRLKEVLGDEKNWEEVRVVPLGKVEAELAEMVGLRRLACLGIKSDHKDIDKLRNLLPKSILHPPRHSLNIPFPTSSLSIHTHRTLPVLPTSPVSAAPGEKKTEADGNKNKVDLGRLTSKQAQNMMPYVHYAPIHVKGITTTLPADGNAKKLKRMEEVRKRRREVKEQKKLKMLKG